tara:strand:- start:3164 stop:5284 length:2121 start_codon:yes stop_codon:yes gene_type:complete
MKQIILDIKTGNISLEEVPVPKVNKDSVLIQTTKSLVSLGTERMLIDFGNANYIQKARQQPEKVKMVLEKIKSDGIAPTIEAIFNKLNEPLPLGYCNVGVVKEIGSNVSNFSVGDRVVSNGHHAEFVSIPQNLVAKIPDNVSDEEAVFTVIGSIGLQGIRLLNPTFGETIVVFGLGLIGLITAEILKANGCNVIGIDVDKEKVKIAKSKNISAINISEEIDEIKFIKSATNQMGADGVIITAANKSDEIIAKSAKMCRKKGRIILVGVVGLNISRSDFYNKEISFQVSCSYGPGRYERNYEEKGMDYPIEYVRWTENRNFEAILNSLSKKQITTNSLITESVPLEDYSKIYNAINNNSIGSIITYNKNSTIDKTIEVTSKNFDMNDGVIGIIGSGNFTQSTLLPNLNKNNAKIAYIASENGLSSTKLAKKFNIAKSTTDYYEILKNPNIDLVMVTTRHNKHAKIVIESLNSNKNIFVEKPLAITNDDLEKIIKSYNDSNQSISVGFNRRFSPLSQKIKKLLTENTNPLNIIVTCNAGFIDKNHWIHDMEIGGGRIIGEACHFIDLCTYFTNSYVSKVCTNYLGESPKDNKDNASIFLKYKNGSNVVLNYFSNGSKSYSKERIEIFSDERTLILDNWHTLYGYGFKNFKKMKTIQNKGHFNQFKTLLENQKNGNGPTIPFDQIINTTRATFGAVESIKNNKWIQIEN